MAELNQPHIRYPHTNTSHSSYPTSRYTSLVAAFSNMPPSFSRARRNMVLAITVVLPVLALIAYLIVVAHWLPGFYLIQVAWSSDGTTYMLLSKTLAEGAGGAIYLSDAQWYSTILIDVLTYHLPNYQVVWIVWPLAAYVLGVGMLSMTVCKLAGRWAALMAAILCLALTPAMLLPFLAQAFHGLTTINCILLAAFLVYLVEHGTHTTWATLVLAAGVGLFTGINMASDLLLVVIGFIPFTGVALILLARYHDHASLRTTSVCMGTIATALGADFLTLKVGQAFLLVPQTVGTRLVRPAEIAPHVMLAGAVIWDEIGAAWGNAATAGSLEELAIGIAALAVVVAAIVLLSLRMFRASPATGSMEIRRLLAHYLIWTAIASSDFAALAFTTAAIDVGAVRYATVLWIASAATLPLLFARSITRRIVFALLLTSLVTVHIGLMLAAQPTPDTDVRAAVAYLESQHIRYGYADYWEANSTTWATDGMLTLRPASSCDAAGMLCAEVFGSAASWYAPQPGSSAVIVDPRHTLSIAPAEKYGPPLHVRHIGRLTIYIYDHDLGPILIKPSPYSQRL